MNRSGLQKLALARLADAQVLFKNRRFAASYYLAGYAVECALKACIARRTKQYDFPPEPEHVRKVYTHNLDGLLRLARVEKQFEAARQSEQAFADYWNVVKDWSESSRYEFRGEKKAKDILRGISDPHNGVLRCIKRYW